MKTLYDRFAEVVSDHHSADEFTDQEYKNYLSDLEEAVKAWLCDGANSISREG